MNRFEDVCGDCPLRTKVDVDTAQECTSWGSDGGKSQLSDGSRRHTVTLYDGAVWNSDAAQDVEDGVQQAIDECNGPKKGLLRQRCGAGLAKAWRWVETAGTYTPNISSPEEILPLLGAADWRDAMPHVEAATTIVGDLRDFSELDCPHNSAFFNYGIMKLTGTVQGTGATLERGKAVMLDRVSSWLVDDEHLLNVFRIRVAQGGPHFAFRSDIVPDHSSPEEQYAKDIEEIFAKGIYAYLFSDTKAIEESNALIAAAQAEANKYSEKARQNHEIARQALRDPRNWRNMN